MKRSILLLISAILTTVYLGFMFTNIFDLMSTAATEGGLAGAIGGGLAVFLLMLHLLMAGIDRMGYET